MPLFKSRNHLTPQAKTLPALHNKDVNHTLKLVINLRKESKVLVDSLNNLNEKMKKLKKERNLHEHNIDHDNHYTYF